MTTDSDFKKENTNISISNFVFTRYLYEKDEVKISLLINILNKKENESLFWAYELYHSGFTDELIQFLWKIYYDFFSTLNPQFENYLLNKLQEKQIVCDKKVLANIISNFLIRPFNMDVFMLDYFVKKNNKPENLQNINKFTTATLKKTFTSFLNTHDYFGIGFCILHICNDEQINTIIKLSIDYFSTFIENLDKKLIISKINKIVSKNNYNKRILVLAKILSYYSILTSLKMGKNIYIVVEDADIVKYETVCVNLDCPQDKPYTKMFPAYKILTKACLYFIDNLDCLTLFHLKRDNADIVDAYLNNWMYYASFSPVWKERILKYNGKIDDELKSVVFDDDDKHEQFCENFNYEPDEQTKDIQNKSIQNIETKITWMSFYESYCNNCLIDFQSNNMLNMKLSL
jgi:hypothetical protein